MKNSLYIGKLVNPPTEQNIKQKGLVLIMEKITNKIALNYVLENCELPTEIHEKIEKILASVEKKNGGSSDGKPTAKQVENTRLGNVVLEVLGTRSMTVTEIMKGSDEFKDLSHSKVNSIVSALKRDGTLIREEVKGKAYFHVA